MMVWNKVFNLTNSFIIKRFLKYFVWWGLAALSDYLIYLYFTQILNIYYITAAVISFCITLIFGFLFQKYITFESKSGAHFKQWTLFVIFQLVWLWIHVWLLHLLVDKFHISEVLAPIFTKWVVFIWNFLMNHYFNFKE